MLLIGLSEKVVQGQWHLSSDLSDKGSRVRSGEDWNGEHGRSRREEREAGVRSFWTFYAMVRVLNSEPWPPYLRCVWELKGLPSALSPNREQSGTSSHKHEWTHAISTTTPWWAHGVKALPHSFIASPDPQHRTWCVISKYVWSAELEGCGSVAVSHLHPRHLREASLKWGSQALPPG